MPQPRGLAHHRARYPELHDPAWLRARYLTDQLSCAQIAELVDFDCTSKAVQAALQRHGIQLRTAATAIALRRGQS